MGARLGFEPVPLAPEATIIPLDIASEYSVDKLNVLLAGKIGRFKDLSDSEKG